MFHNESKKSCSDFIDASYEIVKELKSFYNKPIFGETND